MISSTTYSCGSLSEFNIRKIVVKDQTVGDSAGNKGQIVETKPRMTLALIRETPMSTLIPLPSTSRKETSLVYGIRI